MSTTVKYTAICLDTTNIVAVFGICATVYFEHTASPLGLFFIGLGVLAFVKHCNFFSAMAINLQNISYLRGVIHKRRYYGKVLRPESRPDFQEDIRRAS